MTRDDTDQVSMSNEWAPPPTPKPRRRWPRRLAWGTGGFFLVLLVVYLLATSFTFLELFVLPKVSQTVNARITLEDASIRPFFKVTLRGLKVQTGGIGEPLLTAKEVRARYSLIDIIGGHINVSEVWLDSPTINLLEDENGGTNLGPLLKTSKEEKKPEPPAPSRKSKPLQLHVQSVTITNALIRRQKRNKDGEREVAELSNVSLSLSSLGNAQAGHLGLAAAIKLDTRSSSPGTNATGQLLEAKVSGG